MLITPTVWGMFKDDPWLTKVAAELEVFEVQDDTVLEWDVDVWSGRDLSKYWLKSSGEREGEGTEGDIELVYSQAVSAYWDIQFGLRQTFSSGDVDDDSRSWASIGAIGVAPYFIDVDARVYLGQDSSSQIFVELEREWMLTQEWVLVSELDLLANGKTNPEFLEGSGLAQVEFSVRLGYEHNGYRHLQPFVGVTSHHLFGATKSLNRSAGEQTNDTRLIAGLEFWF